MTIEYKGFTICDDGTVSNKFGNNVGHKQGDSGYVYVLVGGKNVLKHRFIWEAFNGEIPEGMEIDHINTLRDDNRLDNLRLRTHKENCNNPLTKAKYSESNKGKITETLLQKRDKQKKMAYQYTIDGELIGIYESLNEAARQTGVFETSISACCRGKQQTAGGFKWSYN